MGSVDWQNNHQIRVSNETKEWKGFCCQGVTLIFAVSSYSERIFWDYGLKSTDAIF